MNLGDLVQLSGGSKNSAQYLHVTVGLKPCENGCDLSNDQWGYCEWPVYKNKYEDVGTFDKEEEFEEKKVSDGLTLQICSPIKFVIKTERIKYLQLFFLISNMDRTK